MGGSVGSAGLMFLKHGEAEDKWTTDALPTVRQWDYVDMGEPLHTRCCKRVPDWKIDEAFIPTESLGLHLLIRLRHHQTWVAKGISSSRARRHGIDDSTPDYLFWLASGSKPEPASAFITFI